MSYLIATSFAYSVRDEYGRVEQRQGSYLGRKPATAATLRAFVRHTCRQYAPWLSLDTLTVYGNCVSPWRFK